MHLFEELVEFLQVELESRTMGRKRQTPLKGYFVVGMKLGGSHLIETQVKLGVQLPVPCGNGGARTRVIG